MFRSQVSPLAVADLLVLPDLDLSLPGGCRGDCVDCRVLSDGPPRQVRRLLSLLALYREVFASPPTAPADVWVPARLQHLHVSALRFGGPDRADRVRVALTFPGLSGWDLSLLLSWALQVDRGSSDRWSRAWMPHPSLISRLRTPVPGQFRVRRALTYRLLHLLAEPGPHPLSVVHAVEFSGLDVERRDVRLAGLAAGLAGGVLADPGDRLDVVAFLDRLDRMPSPVLEVFTPLVWDAVASPDVPVRVRDLLELARLTVSA